jgi:uncharacterized protein (DUF433 family)
MMLTEILRKGVSEDELAAGFTCVEFDNIRADEPHAAARQEMELNV